ncbi:hypothetical protein EXIGLDRAFT_26563 [Exidia glandulosa HHB12029]|uniref:Secreted protein n=1 Tax=Exidia glandulosa HHB12029 TaxID=1314781 RepID=A0A165P7L1_EXIGL|nr:hypothetical protein EXIGLDRAFT_26563 [Exidia glandulosa HHB12029]
MYALGTGCAILCLLIFPDASHCNLLSQAVRHDRHYQYRREGNPRSRFSTVASCLIGCWLGCED